MWCSVGSLCVRVLGLCVVDLCLVEGYVPGASEVYSCRSCALGDAQRHYYIGTVQVSHVCSGVLYLCVVEC